MRTVGIVVGGALGAVVYVVGVFLTLQGAWIVDGATLAVTLGVGLVISGATMLFYTVLTDEPK